MEDFARSSKWNPNFQINLSIVLLVSWNNIEQTVGLKIEYDSSVLCRAESSDSCFSSSICSSVSLRCTMISPKQVWIADPWFWLGWFMVFGWRIAAFSWLICAPGVWLTDVVFFGAHISADRGVFCYLPNVCWLLVPVVWLTDVLYFGAHIASKRCVFCYLQNPMFLIGTRYNWKASAEWNFEWDMCFHRILRPHCMNGVYHGVHGIDEIHCIHDINSIRGIQGIHGVHAIHSIHGIHSINGIHMTHEVAMPRKQDHALEYC